MLWKRGGARGSELRRSARANRVGNASLQHLSVPSNKRGGPGGIRTHDSRIKSCLCGVSGCLQRSLPYLESSQLDSPCTPKSSRVAVKPESDLPLAVPKCSFSRCAIGASYIRGWYHRTSHRRPEHRSMELCLQIATTGSDSLKRSTASSTLLGNELVRQPGEGEIVSRAFPNPGDPPCSDL